MWMIRHGDQLFVPHALLHGQFPHGSMVHHLVFVVVIFDLLQAFAVAMSKLSNARYPGLLFI